MDSLFKQFVCLLATSVVMSLSYKKEVIQHCSPSVCPSVCLLCLVSVSNSKQELSYRQQIARQLRTQYAEGIHRHKYYTSLTYRHSFFTVR